MAAWVRVREISNDKGNRLLRMVRRSSGSVVTWRRAQMVLLSVLGMDVPEQREQITAIALVLPTDAGLPFSCPVRRPNRWGGWGWGVARSAPRLRRY